MSEVFRAKFEGREHPGALVIQCSDPRYQSHFQQFLHEKCGLDNYALVAVPGGPQFLTLVEYLPKFGWVGWRWVKFMLDATKPPRAILISHEDCRWYQDSRFLKPLAGIHASDLKLVRDAFKERFPEIAVETYLARRDGDHVVFESI